MTTPNRQEIFNTVWNHFVVNRQPRSITGQYLCMYRGPDGCRCAVGVLMSDDEYDHGFENSPMADFMAAVMVPEPGKQFRTSEQVAKVRALLTDPKRERLRNLVAAHGPFLRDLQIAHDTNMDPYSNYGEGRDKEPLLNKAALVDVALRWGLEVPSC